MRIAILAGMLVLSAGLLSPGADDKSTRSGQDPRVGALADVVPKLIATTRAKFDVPALGVVVVSRKGVLTLDVQGVRKAGTPVKVQPTDKFHLGSNTKQFTALLFAVLVQKKKLSYDLTLAKAFPEYARTMPASFRGVTLDLLLRHRAGMPADLPDWGKVPIKGSTRQQRQTVVRWAMESKATIKPDVVYSYSNYGYVLATAMVERVLNDSYPNLLKKYILDPLSVASAGFGPMTRKKNVIDQPWEHEEDGTPVERDKAEDAPSIGPARGLHCSLGDWAKYAADQLKGAHGEKALLPPAAYKKLQEPGGKDEPYTPGGWMVGISSPKGNILMHDGSNTLNYCCDVLDPTRDYAFLVVCNQAGKKRGEAATQSVRNALIKVMLAQTAARAPTAGAP